METFQHWLQVREGWFGGPSSPGFATASGADQAMMQRQQQAKGGMFKDLAVRAAGMVPGLAAGKVPLAGLAGAGIAVYRWSQTNKKLQRFIDAINHHKANIVSGMQRAGDTLNIPHVIRSIFDIDSRVDELLRPEIMEKVTEEFVNYLEQASKQGYANMTRVTLSKLIWKHLQGPVASLQMAVNMAPDSFRWQ